MSHKYHYTARVTRIVDGDTFEALFDLGFGASLDLKCRMNGIDTPEIFGVPTASEEYKKGIQARDWLKLFIEGKDVFVESVKFEKYGRALVTIWLSEPEKIDPATSINKQMVELGLARVYP